MFVYKNDMNLIIINTSVWKDNRMINEQAHFIKKKLIKDIVHGLPFIKGNITFSFD